MGRMHSKGKGISKSAIPYRRTPPTWLKHNADDITKMICTYATKGTPPSKIGILLRDQSGVGQVRFVTGQKILRILRTHGMAPSIPEDLYCLIKKAQNVRKHLEANRRDKDAKFRLLLIEARIHRLARYYRMSRQLPATFKYDSATASALVA